MNSQKGRSSRLYTWLIIPVVVIIAIVVVVAVFMYMNRAQ
jgi:flagellar basal body-associated protein FliL